ncbi:MAG: aldo/keto reductase family protein [Gammaproteobacteria bacterium]|nr:aldo/keto reductase family protein [Gammaproteobacteria bacterium]
MKYRKLGNSDLTISEIGFGSWLTFTDPQRKQLAISCVHRALDLGINFLDTANVYGRGAAETVLGEALAGIKRDSYVLATKLFFPMNGIDRGLSRKQVQKQLEASLKRLRVEYVDLYQCHRYDFDPPLEETMEALTAAVNSGKVRYLGFSEWPLDRIEAALELKNVARFVSSQPQYSLLHREPEKGLLALCAKAGISQVVWSPLAQGVLTGKYLANSPAPANTRAADPSMGGFLNQDWFAPATLQAVQEVGKLAVNAQLTLAQFALAWVLRQPNVASAIVGASRPEQLQENAAASGRRVDPALFAAAERLLPSH